MLHLVLIRGVPLCKWTMVKVETHDCPKFWEKQVTIEPSALKKISIPPLLRFREHPGRGGQKGWERQMKSRRVVKCSLQCASRLAAIICISLSVLQVFYKLDRTHTVCTVSSEPNGGTHAPKHQFIHGIERLSCYLSCLSERQQRVLEYPGYSGKIYFSLNFGRNEAVTGMVVCYEPWSI